MVDPICRRCGGSETTARYDIVLEETIERPCLDCMPNTTGRYRQRSPADIRKLMERIRIDLVNGMKVVEADREKRRIQNGKKEKSKEEAEVTPLDGPIIPGGPPTPF